MPSFLHRLEVLVPVLIVEAMLVGEALSIPIVGFICQPDHKIEETHLCSSTECCLSIESSIDTMQRL